MSEYRTLNEQEMRTGVRYWEEMIQSARVVIRDFKIDVPEDEYEVLIIAHDLGRKYNYGGRGCLDGTSPPELRSMCDHMNELRKKLKDLPTN